MSDSELLGVGVAAIAIYIVLGIIGLVVYFIPTIVAVKKKSRKKVAAILLNIFLGWSLVGWIISLVLACKKPVPQAAPTVNTTAAPPQNYQ